jgi:hypothetical protein
MLKLALITTLGLIVVSMTIQAENMSSHILKQLKNKVSNEELFKNYIFLFEKDYSFDSQEGRDRFKIFQKSLIQIEKLNEKGGSMVTYGFTNYSDKKEDELPKPTQIQEMPSRSFNNPLLENEKVGQVYRETDESQQGPWQPIDYTNIPFTSVPDTSYPYYEYGAINYFGAYFYRKSGTFPLFSVQQIRECVQNCIHLNYIDGPYFKDVGLYLEKDYPFSSTTGTCKTLNSVSPYKVDKWFEHSLLGPEKTIIKHSLTEEIYEALRRYGPLHALLGGLRSDHFNYTGGIYTPTVDCRAVGLSCYSSAGVIIGYGYDQNLKVEYWIFRGSWHSNFGEKGNMRVPRHDDLYYYTNNWGLSSFYALK